MEAQNSHQKIMKNSKKNERLKIHACTGDIIVLGATIIAAAIGAAFVAHMGRRRSNNRERERRKNDEERGLQSLLHLGKGESSTDSLIIQENKGRESLPVEYHGEEESEKGEDGSEESGDSSIESSNEAVWPAEATEQEKEIPISDLKEMKHHQSVSVDDIGMGMQSIFPYKSNNDQGDDEFAFGNSVENQETKFVEAVAENAFNVNTNVGTVVVNDFSFWSDKQTTPQGQSAQCIEKSDIAHVTKNELFDEEVERKGISEEEVEKEEISETNEVKQQLELSKTTGDIFASECLNNTGVLENLLPSSIYTEQQNGHVSVDTLEGTKEEEEAVLNSKSQEVKEFDQVVGTRGGEESEGSRNCLEVSSDQSICLEEILEQEKLDDLMPTDEINDQHDILRKFESMNGSADGYTNYNNNPVQESSSDGAEFDTLDKENGENLDNLKIADIEVDLIEKEEEEGDDDDEREEGDQNAHREVVESEEEEKGRDGLVHLNAKVKAGDDTTDIDVEEVEKDENGGDGVGTEVENEGRGDDFAHIEAEEEEEQQSRGDLISNMEVEVLEKDENGGDVVAMEVEFQARVDDIAHIEVEEEQQQNGGNDITPTKSMSENEVQKGDHGIAHTEVEVVKEEVEGEEEKEENEEGITDTEVKGVEVDEAKEEREDAKAHIQVEVAGEEEQKGGDNTSYTEVEELRAAEAEEEDEEKVHCVAYIQVEEEKGDNSTHEEEDMVEVVKEDEKEGEDIKHMEVPKEKGKGKLEDGEQESLSLKSEKEIRSLVQNKENEIQESIRSDSASMELNAKEVCTAEEVGLEKHLGPMFDTKQNLETHEKINEMVGITSAERDENTNGGIQSFLPNNDKNIEVPVGISLVVQEKVHVKDMGAVSQNTCKSFEMAREADESMSLANVHHGNSVTKEGPCNIEISSFLQDDNKQDLQEPDFSCIVEEKDGLCMETEIESCIEKDGESVNDESEETRISSMRTIAETVSQTGVPEEEKRLLFIENEMKLQSEMPKKATAIVNSIAQVENNGQEHEQKVPHKESEITVTGKGKKMDFMLTGHSKGLFFFVLALALALGFLALAYDDQIHSYNHHLPKKFHQLYQYLLSIL